MEKLTQKSKRHPYGFPYDPYEVQIKLMDNIYDMLSSDKKLGLYESPTGTVRQPYLFIIQGKTMSLICSILTWYLKKKPY